MRFCLTVGLASLLIAQSVRAGFTDVTDEANVSYLQWNALPGELQTLRMTGGAAAGDVDGDGYPDLLVTRPDGPEILFLNDREGGFTDVSSTSGFTRNLPGNGTALGDIDNDGDLDAYVTSLGDRRHYLYINDGTGVFTEEGRPRNAAIATDEKHFGTSVALGDYDRDGFLDIHTSEWGNVDYQVGVLYSNARLLRNVGTDNPGHYVDATVASNLVLDEYVGYSPKFSAEGLWTFTSTFADFDRDGHPDLAIAGDFHTSRLYWNNGDGRFTMAPGPFQPPPQSGIGTDENGMGSAIADFNGDGLLDWFVTAIYDETDPCYESNCNWNSSGNRLYLNNGDRTFTDVTDAAGVREGGWGWGTTFFDYDNDGDQDLVMTNGMFSLSPLADPFLNDPMRLWRNEGDGTFTEVSQLEGLTDTRLGKGLLTFDYDLDGDLDLFVVNNADTPVLYRNDSDNGNAFLRVKTEGTQSNRDGVGAFLTLWADADSAPQTRYVTGGGVNFLSQSEMTVHFGLGQRDEPIHKLLIEWPSGLRQVLSNIDINSTLLAVEPDQLPGDFDQNGVLDVADINQLTAAAATGDHEFLYDLNDDSLVDSQDVTIWVRDLNATWIGDVNLDGEFKSDDLIEVLAANTYEKDVDAVWTSGDFNGDGRFKTGDLIDALADNGYEKGPRAWVRAVPEPQGFAMLLVGLVGFVRKRQLDCRRCLDR